MQPVRRCHCCGTHFRPSTARRHGRLRRLHRVDPDAAVPATAFVCADCRPEVVELTRHWSVTEPLGGACGFCDRAAAETGLVDLASLVGDRVVSRGAYLLCRGCEDVFGTFLADLHEGVDLPAAWRHRPAPSKTVFERGDGLRVEATGPAAPTPRVRLFVDSEPLLSARADAVPRERAREFVAAFEAFYPETEDLRRLGEAVVAGNPRLGDPD